MASLPSVRIFVCILSVCYGMGYAANSALTNSTQLKTAMESNGVVPELIAIVPGSVAKVRFGSAVEMIPGGELTPRQVKDLPTEVRWPTEPNALYSLFFTDPDAPSRTMPLLREIIHWLVVNIPETDLTKGDTILNYTGSGPPEGGGLHRYVLFVFKQSGRLSVDSLASLKANRTARYGVNGKDFVAKHNLGVPVAGNFFLSQCDDYIRQQREHQLEAAMKEHGIVPSIIDSAPTSSAGVFYTTGKALMNHGNELKPSQVQEQPDVVAWKAQPNTLYTILMIDPDAPSRADPKYGDGLHWLVVNAPGMDISKGETFAEYVGSGPPQGTGLHRYILLVFAQNSKLTLNRPKINKQSIEGRISFKTKQFIKENNFGVPIAGNFFQAQYDAGSKLHK